MFVGDDHRRRRVLLEQPLVEIGRRDAIGRPRARHARGDGGTVERRRRTSGSASRLVTVPALVDVRRLVDAHEQVVRAFRRFRRAEEQIAARPQREMERLDQPLLDRPIQVDQQVAAGDEVEVRERRILDDVVLREEHHLAQLAADAVAGRLADEEPLQALL